MTRDRPHANVRNGWKADMARGSFKSMTDTPDAERVALIRLSSDQAIVFFDLLTRWSDAKEGSTPSRECFESTAECAVLNNVRAGLERQLVAPFKNSYDDVVRDARSRLALRWDYPTLRG